LFYTGALVLPAVLVLREVPRPEKRVGWIALAVLAPAVAAHAAFVAPNDLQVVDRDLDFAGWPKEAPRFTLVQISDLQTVGDCERQDEAVRRINALEPDLIAICGDYVAGPFFEFGPFEGPGPAIESARRFLGGLRAKHGIVAVKGHSETRALRERVFAGLAVRYLDDAEFTLELGPDRRLRILGLGYDAPRFEPRREAGTVTIAVGHGPDQSRLLIGREVDLHLAGHTHGGQIVVPGFGAPVILSSLPRRFARGLFGFGDHWLSVTPGIGMEGFHAPRVRLFSPPEIDVFRLGGGGSPFVWVEPPAAREFRARPRGGER
jgi:predicted MPP superfamily phosphohydrolase